MSLFPCNSDRSRGGRKAQSVYNTNIVVFTESFRKSCISNSSLETAIDEVPRDVKIGKANGLNVENEVISVLLDIAKA